MLARKQNETEFEYKVRLCVAKLNKEIDLDWVEIVEMLELDYSGCHLRKLGYAYKEYFEYLKDKERENLSDKAIIEELNQKIIELKLERVKTQDERREYSNIIKNEARWQNLKDRLIESIGDINISKPLISPDITPVSYGGAKASLLLSDWHIGAVIDNQHNRFNIEVAKERILTLADKTIEYCNLHEVEELNLVILGDLIHGIIHVSTRIYSEVDVIRQTTICAEMLSAFIHKVSTQVPLVNVHFSVGNHSRVVANYKEHLDVENFEYLILWYLKTRLDQLRNVCFCDNKFDDEVGIIEIFNKKIAFCHGHKDKPQTALNNLSRFMGVMFDEIYMGHYHDMKVMQGTTINGSLIGSDQYAQSKRFGNNPCQVLKIYYENNDELIYRLDLKG